MHEHFSEIRFLYPVIAIISVIIILVMSSITRNKMVVETMDTAQDTCPPCDQCQEEDDGTDAGVDSNGRKKKKKRKSNAQSDPDAMSPTDPNYANMKTIREQRMVQEKSIMDTLKQEFESLLLTPVASFCEHNKTNGSALQAQCSALTYDNCNSTSCCIWAGASSRSGKCMAGGIKGAMYSTNPDGTPVNVDTYYFQNKCTGPQCELSKMQRMSKMIHMKQQRQDQ